MYHIKSLSFCRYIVTVSVQYNGIRFNTRQVDFDTNVADLSLTNLGNFRVDDNKNLIIYWVGIDALTSREKAKIEKKEL